MTRIIDLIDVHPTGEEDHGFQFACGCGSLLIKVGRQADERDYALFGQEMNGTTHALCRMNMFLHGMDNFRIEWGDMLRNPRLIEGDRLMKFDIVVANPPFSLDNWGYDEASADPFHRYHRGLPPKSKGDWAFISHMVEIAREGTGRVGVVVPHGVLFRGAAEGRIRQKLKEEAEIDLGAVKQEIASLESQLASVRAKMAAHLKELGL